MKNIYRNALLAAGAVVLIGSLTIGKVSAQMNGNQMHQGMDNSRNHDWNHGGQGDRHDSSKPHMADALQSLRSAQSELQTATDSEGGHRKHALDLVNEAIDQVQRSLSNH